MSGSLLFLQPSMNNMTYAAISTLSSGGRPHWSFETIHPDFSPAFNVGLRYHFGSGADIQALLDPPEHL